MGAITQLLGASRGFAFVEFNRLPEAERWMEVNQVASKNPLHDKALTAFVGTRLAVVPSSPVGCHLL